MKVKNFLDKNCCLKSSRKCERLLVETVVIPIVYQGYRCWWRLVVLHYGCSFGGSSRWTNDGEDGLRVRVLLVGGSSLQGGLEELSLRKNLFRGGVPVRIRVTCWRARGCVVTTVRLWESQDFLSIDSRTISQSPSSTPIMNNPKNNETDPSNKPSETDPNKTYPLTKKEISKKGAKMIKHFNDEVVPWLQRTGGRGSCLLQITDVAPCQITQQRNSAIADQCLSMGSRVSSNGPSGVKLIHRHFHCHPSRSDVP